VTASVLLLTYIMTSLDHIVLHHTQRICIGAISSALFEHLFVCSQSTAKPSTQKCPEIY